MSRQNCDLRWAAWIFLLMPFLFAWAPASADDDIDPHERMGYVRFSDAVDYEMAKRDCIARCRAKFGEAYPCEQKCTFDLCMQHQSEGEDRRFMSSGTIHPDCLPHHHVLQQAIQKYEEGKARIDLEGIRNLIEEARKHAEAADAAVRRTENAWLLADRAAKSATWAEGELRKAEALVDEGRDSCGSAPSLAAMKAAASNIEADASESLNLLSRTKGYIAAACRSDSMVAENDRDPYLTSRQKRSYLLKASNHTALIGAKAVRAANRASEVLAMEEARFEARRRMASGRDAIAPAILSIGYSKTEIAGLLAQTDSYLQLLGKAQEDENEAARLKAQALEFINRQHHKSSSRFTSESEQLRLTTEVNSFLAACGSITLPSVPSVRTVVIESRDRITKALARTQQAEQSARRLEGQLSASCKTLDEPMEDIVRRAEGSADELRRSQQQADTLIVGAKDCGTPTEPDSEYNNGGFVDEGSEVSLTERTPGDDFTQASSTAQTIEPPGYQDASTDGSAHSPLYMETRCSRLAAQLNAAVQANSLGDFRQIVGQSPGCAFYPQAVADLNRIEAANQKCMQLAQAMDVARNSGNWHRFRSLLPLASDCPFYQQALADERSASQGQRAQQLLNSMQSIMQSMRPPSSSSVPPPRQSTPPATAPSRPTASTPPLRAAPQCRNVCVKQETRYLNVTDGRHGLCAGKAGRVYPGWNTSDNKPFYVVCEKNTVCLKWERRCQ